ncbi:hypothetical protein OUZ56_017034 [Daphnia magna]|uniref:BED-type domain-containing protein n=1 Tax=Daphnia magna TaxID=35525 RepID=A0ABR0ARZ6_9CRUS|nr:hypothetical protein OUZ56_017034 [Daphnia magna]
MILLPNGCWLLLLLGFVSPALYFSSLFRSDFPQRLTTRPRQPLGCTPDAGCPQTTPCHEPSSSVSDSLPAPYVLLSYHLLPAILAPLVSCRTLRLTVHFSASCRKLRLTVHFSTSCRKLRLTVYCPILAEHFGSRDCQNKRGRSQASSVYRFLTALNKTERDEDLNSENEQSLLNNSSNKRSLVHAYFIYDKTSDTSKCKTCTATVKGSNTTNLENHLKIKKHISNEYLQYVKAKENAALSKVSSNSKKIVGAKAKSLLQPTLPQISMSKAKYTRKNTKQLLLRKKLAFVVATTSMTLSISDNKDWQAYVELLDPRHIIPGRKALANGQKVSESSSSARSVKT